uniref:Uncharacterized protein n=1 Tax=Chaetoceros debilis TaxID=122233 RepID=A0A7S3VEL9_9STRA
MMLLKAVCGMAATIAAGPISGGFAAHDDSDAVTTSNSEPDTSDLERELKRKMGQVASNLAEQEMKVKKIEREIENLKNEGDSPATAAKIAQAKQEKKKAKAELGRLRKIRQ